jgi:Arc/MetJ-type ribon-helix-helix transcriptional regulator
MQIALTPEQRDFVRLAVEEGRVRSLDQAVAEAMALWIERERRRAEMLASLDVAESSLSRGKASR